MYKNDMIIPDVLNGCDSIDLWKQKRAAVLNAMAESEYGRRPGIDYELSWAEELREPVKELSAIHIRTILTIRTQHGSYSFPVTVFLPERVERAPAAVLICSQSKRIHPPALPKGFEGKSPGELAAAVAGMFENFHIVMDPFGSRDMMTGTGTPVPLDLDSDYDNGHWPVREMTKRGFAMVGFYAADAEPDDAASYPSGLAKIFNTGAKRDENEWGVLAVWAFAASCVRQYISSMNEIDAQKIAVVGHSRCGKAALWCGANDENFAAVMPNGSGCCGAALSRGKTGENLASIQAFFPHWFAPFFRTYAGREDALPYDQHFLLAAVAPRLLHVASGSEDAWADPEGEHYSTYLASAVWELWEKQDSDDTDQNNNCILPKDMPHAGGAQICGRVGYHLRPGPHKLDTFDWICLAEHMSV
ncbi:MAG: hypothetical protein LUE29_05545 [Lachnospiraceae bacterium]|nr:hypothetical protein [Lachnospiraceae bacterium]